MIIHSLGESGQPPKWRASSINVGTEGFLGRLREDYLQDLCQAYNGSDGGGACKWVEADYGKGKTQFLRCVQEMAWSLDYLTAYVELSQDECPLDRADRVFGAVARNIQAAPQNLSDVDRSKGLDIALCQLLDRRFPGVLTGMPSESLRAEALEWVKTLRNTPVESTAFATAVAEHLIGRLENDDEKARVSGMYLRGEPLPAAELKSVGVYEKLDKASGFRLLRSMCQLVQRSGMAAGVVLLFDEARRTLSLMSIKSQKTACENLLSVINRCNSGELPGTLFLYAVMPEFFTNFATAYPALQQRCGPATRIDLDSLQGLKEVDLLQQIGQKLADLFRGAYENLAWKEDVLASNLRLVADAVTHNQGETGSRRLLVKSWIQVLDKSRRGPMTVLSSSDVEALLAGVGEQVVAAVQEAVESEGE